MGVRKLSITREQRRVFRNRFKAVFVVALVLFSAVVLTVAAN